MSGKKLTAKNLQNIEKNIVGITDQDVLPAEIMQMLSDKIPPWLQEYEADGTAVMRWMHEYLIMIEEILRIDFGFQEGDMEKIEKRIKELLPILHKEKMENTRLLRKADMAIGIDIVERNKALFKAEKLGIALPDTKPKKLK